MTSASIEPHIAINSCIAENYDCSCYQTDNLQCYNAKCHAVNQYMLPWAGKEPGLLSRHYQAMCPKCGAHKYIDEELGMDGLQILALRRVNANNRDS